MTSPPEAPNPLRPYYVPPSIGLPAGQSVSKISPNGPPSAASGNITSFGSSAREIFSDFDYSDYLGESSPSVAESIKQLLESALWRYSRVLISQPFEVAKTILQVYVVQDEQEIRALDERRGQDRSYRESIYTDQSSYSSDDEDSYFAPAAPAASASASRTRRPPHRITDRGGYIPQSTKPGYMLKIKDPSALFDVLAQLWTTNGPTSIWKGSTSTFVYSLLLPTLNTFIRSLLSAIIGYPEDSFSTILESDILTSTSPGAALVLTCLSAALASIVLSPVDTARTYLILSPVGTARLPIFPSSYLSFGPGPNPSRWGLFTLMASGLELGVRIPLETVLRRAQIATFTSPVLRQQSITRTTVSASSSSQENVTSAIQTVVPTPDTYRGIVGTMWSIVYEEGTDGGAEAVAIERVLGRPPEPTTAGPAGRVPRRRRGQGIRGLYRSWRLEMWGIVGIWGSGFLGALLGPGDEEVLVESGAAMGLGPVGGRGSAGAF
ncbi:mitochondrial fusion and transport protein Ugo1 [Coccidioides immitis H538.4]|uniref:Mitochondrial fusion and transport protein Ugo1 n=1 Tax=Coccidioides immitis H538.4 TaxID=396776 RepID=A0A0J8U866_COCIT|nr:mitochondrial fusion and transport protein Ugo1 [Coccidioides immitis H538.4]